MRSRLTQGDVLRYEYRLPYADTASDEWFIVTEDSDTRSMLVGAVCVHSREPKRVGMTFSVTRFGSDDTDRKVPPEEWPDEVCRAVALYKLTGEMS